MKTLVGELLLPLPVALGLDVLGLGVVWLGRRRLGVSLTVAGLALLGLASWAPVADRLLAPLEGEYSALETLPEDQALAGVVVLGAGWVGQAPWSITGKLSESSALRLMEGLRLWRQRPSLPLVVIGASREPKALPAGPRLRPGGPGAGSGARAAYGAGLTNGYGP